MKLITFSLWGDSPKYCVGAIQNAKRAILVYPEWRCRFYVAKSVPEEYVEMLESFSNTDVVRKDEEGDWRGMFWRFEAASEDDVEVMISRDTDSRLMIREKAAVDAWLNDFRGVHIMKDHPFHGCATMLGGMWGAKKGAIPNIHELINNFEQKDEYGTDYKFFDNVLYPLIKDNCLIHDDFFGGTPFPTERDSLEFIGQVFDERDVTVPEHLLALQKHLWNNNKFTEQHGRIRNG